MWGLDFLQDEHESLAGSRLGVGKEAQDEAGARAVSSSAAMSSDQKYKEFENFEFYLGHCTDVVFKMAEQNILC